VSHEAPSTTALNKWWGDAALSSSPTTLPSLAAFEETVESRPIIGVNTSAIGLRRKAPVVQSREKTEPVIIKPLVSTAPLGLSADMGVTAALDDVGAIVPDAKIIFEEAEYGRRNRTLSSPSFATTALGMQMPVVVKGLASASNVAHNVTLSATLPSPQTGLPSSSSTEINDRMSKGYIQPHYSHLPRRRPRANLKERARTVATPPIPGSIPTQEGKTSDRPALEIQTESETLPLAGAVAAAPRFVSDPVTFQPAGDSTPELAREETRDDGEKKAGGTLIHPTPPLTLTNERAPLETLNKSASPGMRSKGHTEPHRNHLPRRVAKAKGVNLSLPLSSVDTVMDISHPVESESDSPGADPTTPAPLEPYPTPPLLGGLGQGTDLSSTLAALISAAQNKHKTNSNDVYADELPTSPDLPHPAMGLTMGLMNAVAAQEAAAGVNDSNPIRMPGSRTPMPMASGTPVPYPSPALGVFGSPGVMSGSAAGLLRANLPRRHRRRREQEQEEMGGGRNSRRESLAESLERKKEEPRVLRFERVIVRDEGGDGEAGVLDFGSESESGLETDSGRVRRYRSRHRATSAPAKELSKGSRRRSKSRCLQVLGHSRVELGFLRPNDPDSCVLVQAVDPSCESEEAESTFDKRTLKLALSDEKVKASREGVSSLTPAQIVEACEFVRSSLAERRQGDRIRILCPRGRPEDAMAIALCYLAWTEVENGSSESQSSQTLISFCVNDLEGHEDSSRLDDKCATDYSLIRPDNNTHPIYSPIHLLYMRLLDDDDGEWCKPGRRTTMTRHHVSTTAIAPSSASGLIGLGIAGLDAKAASDESGNAGGTTSTNPNSNSDSAGHRRVVEEEEESSTSLLRGRSLARGTVLFQNGKGKGRVLHIREAALGGGGGGTGGSLLSSRSFSPLPLSSVSRTQTVVWKGLEDEWRGVLSFEGLNELVGVWP